MHYKRLWRHGNPGIVLPFVKKATFIGCKADGCDRKHRMNGYCNMHAQRFRHHKDASIVLKGGLKKQFNSLSESFESRIEKISESGCWIWMGAQITDGYGCLSWDGRTQLAHRVAYELYVGEIPEGMYVLHKCDIPECCNPNHLFLGYQIDNIRDMVNKKRQKGAVGENNPSAFLSEQDVLDIKALLEKGLSGAEIARKFNVTKTTVSRIKLKKGWKHL